jgi:tripartite-type tricarboxylate transporter receptor subunit TctC
MSNATGMPESCSPSLPRRSVIATALGASAGALFGARSAAAQDYPNRSVRIVVPFVVGGGPDNTARVIAEALGRDLGQRFFADNVAGAGTLVGTTAAARARPDGHTLLLASNSLALIPSLRRNLPYDTVRDFRGVGMVVRQPIALAVHPSVANSLPELLALARERPGQINYASSGAGTGNHLFTEQFLKMAGVRMEHVPYQGTGGAFTDLLANRVQMIFTTASSLLTYFQSGQLRPLGVGETEEIAQLPGVPPIASAVPGFNETSWNGIVVPTGTPPEIIRRLNDSIAKALAEPEIRATFERSGALPWAMSPERFDAFIVSEIAKWREVIEMTGLRVE